MKYFVLLFFFSLHCLADSEIKSVRSCELKSMEIVKLISLGPKNDNTLYLKFRNIITEAFLDSKDDNYNYSGEIVLAKCINNSLIYSMEYGSPYIKGCLVTGWEGGYKEKHAPEGFCWAERFIPEEVWFGRKNVIIVIHNPQDVISWDFKYVLIDNSKEFGRKRYSSDTLPSRQNYKIFRVK